MLKLKTKKGVAKRFKLTANGKVKRKMAFKSHLLTKKSSNRKRRLGKMEVVSSSEVKKIKKMLPYA
ncbi:50S ribosomal protein L35 [bacterium]|nr:50S ribosomal protein L35 [bacterium]MBU1154108.1 50S ribosomal protein L35 [bacterium]MBU1782470.1 50S ribosomal protein L35 [bacterium]MBU2599977.1 50S ribosomal protein L35 [bacterium]